MKATVFLTLVCVSAALAGEKKTTKRGVFGESLGLSLGGVGLGHGLSLGPSIGASGPIISGGGLGGIDLGASLHTHTTITRNVGIPVPQPYPVTVERNIAVPVPVKVAVPVDRPVAVHVPRPYPVPVIKHVAVPVDRPYPVPVKVAVPVPVKVGVPVAVSHGISSGLGLSGLSLGSSHGLLSTYSSGWKGW